jgi:hypothetical protein
MWRVFVLMLGGLIGPQNPAERPAVPKADPPKADYIKKTIHVEIRGTLEEDPTDIFRPREVSHFVKVDGKSYYLDLRGNKTLWGKVSNMKYQSVLIKGTLEVDGRWNIVVVDSVEQAPNQIIACGRP